MPITMWLVSQKEVLAEEDKVKPGKFHRWGRAGESTRSWFGSRSWCQCSREGSYKCMNLGRCWSRWLRCGRACCWCSSSSPGRRRGRPIRRGSCTARGPCTIRVCIPDIGRTDRRMVRSSRYRIWNKNNFDQNLSSLLKQKQSFSNFELQL